MGLHESVRSHKEDPRHASGPQRHGRQGGPTRLRRRPPSQKRHTQTLRPVTAVTVPRPYQTLTCTVHGTRPHAPRLAPLPPRYTFHVRRTRSQHAHVHVACSIRHSKTHRSRVRVNTRRTTHTHGKCSTPHTAVKRRTAAGGDGARDSRSSPRRADEDAVHTVKRQSEGYHVPGTLRNPKW